MISLRGMIRINTVQSKSWAMKIAIISSVILLVISQFGFSRIEFRPFALLVVPGSIGFCYIHTKTFCLPKIGYDNVGTFFFDDLNVAMLVEGDMEPTLARRVFGSFRLYRDDHDGPFDSLIFLVRCPILIFGLLIFAIALAVRETDRTRRRSQA